MAEYIIGFAVLGVILFIVGTYLLAYFVKLRNFIHRAIPAKLIPNPAVHDTLERIDPLLFKTVIDYFKNSGSVFKYEPFVTSAFIREVYYATSRESIREMPMSEMKKKLARLSKERATFRKYRLAAAALRPDQTVVLTVDRTFSNKEQNSVTYILEKTNAGWKFSHIARIITGVVQETFPVNGNTAYIVGVEDGAMFFLDSAHRDIQATDEIAIEGYLETAYHLHGNFFYHTVAVRRLTDRAPLEMQLLN